VEKSRVEREPQQGQQRENSTKQQDDGSTKVTRKETAGNEDKASEGEVISPSNRFQRLLGSVIRLIWNNLPGRGFIHIDNMISGNIRGINCHNK